MGIAQTAIDRVTIYRNGALVVRRGTASSGEVSVPGLSLLFSSDSVRVRPSRGVAQSVRETCNLEAEGARESADETRMAELELELAMANDELRALDALTSALSTARPQAANRSTAFGLPSPTAWIELHRFIEDESLALAQRRSAVETTVEKAKRELSAIRSRASVDAAPPTVSRGVAFELEAEGAGEVEFELEYFVSAARWYPSYSFELGGSDQAALTMSALVANATGEAWDDAALSFSTSDLARESTLPELLSWRMGRRQPPRAPAFRDLPSGLEELFGGYDDGRRNAIRASEAPPPSPSSPQPRRSDTLADQAPVDEYPSGGATRFDEAESTTGVGMHHVEMMNAPMQASLDEIALLSDDDEFEGAPFEMDEARPEPMARRSRGVMPRRDKAKKQAKESSIAGAMAPPLMAMSAPPPGFGGGGAEGADLDDFDEPTSYDMEPPDEVPERFRYAYLRLRDPEAAQRGELHPLDPIDHLWDLVEDTTVGSPRLLRRATSELERTSRNVLAAGRPKGVSDLGDAYPWVFESSGRHRVAADGRYHRVSVMRQERSAEMELRAVPKANLDVYRYCLLAPQGETPLPSGPLAVRENGRFVVNTSLDGTGAGKMLELNLGVEPKLRLERVAHVKQEEKGLVSQSSHVEHEVKLVATSALEQHVPLVVYERVPVAAEGEKDIEVELIATSPEANKNDRGPDGEKLRGGFHLRSLVAPGERKEMSYRYRIVVPAKAELVGGNRRE